MDRPIPDTAEFKGLPAVCKPDSFIVNPSKTDKN